MAPQLHPAQVHKYHAVRMTQTPSHLPDDPPTAIRCKANHRFDARGWRPVIALLELSSDHTTSLTKAFTRVHRMASEMAAITMKNMRLVKLASEYEWKVDLG
mmetsp:Transcript_39890/g.105389  ORF Transcript_39890/g.105389 Transcript_39890/m.105389 type:complete len:102 (-) Transcript_39890:187-492(-)